MVTHDAVDAEKPIKVVVVNDVQSAPVERRSTLVTFVPNTTPVCILPYSNKRIHAVISVVPIATGNTGQAFLTKDQSGALNVSSTYNAGAMVGPGSFDVVGTGEWWLVSNGVTDYTVSVIAEYEP
jgi:hypothetical protein